MENRKINGMGERSGGGAPFFRAAREAARSVSVEKNKKSALTFRFLWDIVEMYQPHHGAKTEAY